MIERMCEVRHKNNVILVLTDEKPIGSYVVG